MTALPDPVNASLDGLMAAAEISPDAPSVMLMNGALLGFGYLGPYGRPCTPGCEICTARPRPALRVIEGGAQ